MGIYMVHAHKLHRHSFQLWSPLNHLLTPVILVRVACGSNIHGASYHYSYQGGPLFIHSADLGLFSIRTASCATMKILVYARLTTMVLLETMVSPWSFGRKACQSVLSG